MRLNIRLPIFALLLLIILALSVGCDDAREKPETPRSTQQETIAATPVPATAHHSRKFLPEFVRSSKALWTATRHFSTSIAGLSKSTPSQVILWICCRTICDSCHAMRTAWQNWKQWTTARCLMLNWFTIQKSCFAYRKSSLHAINYYQEENI